jgi:hypothetical protein
MSLQSSEINQMRLLHHTLPVVIIRDGYRSVQLHRTGRIAIYRRKSLRTASSHFEVIKILVERHTRKLPSGSIRNVGDESYPSSSAWGIYGWTFSSLEKAQCKCTQISEREGSK